MTGASRGIGEAVAIHLQNEGHQVYKPAHAELDLEDALSIDAFCKQYSDTTFDVLVNNARINDIHMIENICLMVYQNVYLSVYIIILLFCVIGYHNSNAHKNKYGAIIAKLSGYTFWFYLWHSFVLHQIYEQISITGIMMTHIKLLLCGAVISLGLSVVFENACSLLLKPLLYRVQNYEGSIGKLLLQFLLIPTCSVGMVLGLSACNSWGIFYKNAYPQFLGDGSLETPYLIQNKDDLEMLRDMVNEGEEFKDICFFQTQDIDLENEEWIPIGIYDSGNYFRGTYDGGGHIIENLCITRVYSTPSNVGFFGILAGTVKNFGIETGYIEGDCVGGITSHGAESALILNCYNKAYIKGTARAGGICDNLCDGSVINCANSGKIEAPNAAQLVSYNAKRIIAAHLDQSAFTDCFEGVYINLPVFEESIDECLNRGIDILVNAEIIAENGVVKW